MKKLIILSCICCFVAVQSWAQDNLYIQQSDGNVSEVAIANLQKITFVDGNLVVTLADGNTSSYVISAINNLTFTVPSAIDNATIKKEHFVSYSSDKNLININVEKGAKVKVYGANGQLVIDEVASDNGTLNLSGLSKGVYIIKSNNQTAKIIKL